MNLFGTISGLVVLLTCAGMIIFVIKQERVIRRRKIKRAYLSIRRVIACLGIICNVFFGSSALALSLEPSPHLPHDLYLVWLLMTSMGYMLFFFYFVQARRLIKQLI